MPSTHTDPSSMHRCHRLVVLTHFVLLLFLLHGCQSRPDPDLLAGQALLNRLRASFLVPDTIGMHALQPKESADSIFEWARRADRHLSDYSRKLPDTSIAKAIVDLQVAWAQHFLQINEAKGYDFSYTQEGFPLYYIIATGTAAHALHFLPASCPVRIRAQLNEQAAMLYMPHGREKGLLHRVGHIAMVNAQPFVLEAANLYDSLGDTNATRRLKPYFLDPELIPRFTELHERLGENPTPDSSLAQMILSLFQSMRGFRDLPVDIVHQLELDTLYEICIHNMGRPANGSGPYPDQALASLLGAEVAKYVQGDLPKAMERCRWGMNIRKGGHPLRDNLQFLLATCLLEQGNYEEAIQQFEIEGEGFTGPGRLGAVLALDALGQRKEAVALWQAELLADPDVVQYCSELARSISPARRKDFGKRLKDIMEEAGDAARAAEVHQQFQ